jgi:predicted short-subunit dehydrogenase-like oxidoreductase (DUF2520 family)
LDTKKTDIAFIGAGKISYSIADALLRNGYKISFAASSSLKSAQKFAKKFKIKFFSDSLTAVPESAGLIIIAVPDSQIKSVALKLAGQKINFKKTLFIHLSGSENISVLKSLKEKGGLVASFHIMQTFPSKRIVKIRNCFCAVETNNPSAKKFLFQLAGAIGLKPFGIESEEKVYYHLAGVFASNFLTANFFNSEQLLNKNKKLKITHSEIFKPIINQTLKNLESHGITGSISGPVERGDIKTVLNHIKTLKQLKNERNSILLKTYLCQSLCLINALEGKPGKLSGDHLKIKMILYDEIKR